MRIHSNSAAITAKCLQFGANAPFSNGDGTYDIHCNPLSSGSVNRDCAGLKAALQAMGVTVDALTASESIPVTDSRAHDRS